MRKLATIIFILFLSNLNPVHAKTFSDIGTINKFYLSTQYLSAKGIIKGYNDGTFKADQEINRAELLKILLKGANIELIPSQTNCFNDTPYLEWYSSYICTGKLKKIVNGYLDGSFKPWQTVTKSEALKMIGEVYKWEIGLPTKNWYQRYFDFAETKNLLMDDEYEPNKEMTRGDVAEVIYRFLVMQELNAEKFDPKSKNQILDLIEIAETQNTNELEEKENSKKILAEGEITITLSWNEETDEEQKENFSEKLNFEAHLIKPNGEEMDFLNKIDNELNVIVDSEKNSEKITIRNLEEGNYEFFVYQYSGDKNFSEAGAKIEIYDKNGLAALYSPENNPNLIWKPFEITENRELTDMNLFGYCEIIKNLTIVCPQAI